MIPRVPPLRLAVRPVLATAVGQMAVAAIAVLAGLGAPASGPVEILGANGLFVTLWVGSAWLFRKAAGRRSAHVTATA